MPQYGAATTITPRTRLILLDCFETVVELHGQTYRARLGMREFLLHFGVRRGIPIVVVSDAHQEAVTAALEQAQVADCIAAVYHAGNAAEARGSGWTRKRLDLPVKDFGVKPDQAVFIGDSPMDADAARHHRTQFIRVPRSEDRDFTFASLITGPSRYRSTEFQAVFLKHYRGDQAGGGPT
jgi:phosphoglycolate phosphatase-like HAD superfamily hydrolase